MSTSVRIAPAGEALVHPQGVSETDTPFQRAHDTAAPPEGWYETHPPCPRESAETEALDIAPALTPEERTRLDLLAVSRGATAEGMAAAAVKRLLAKSAKRPHAFRLTMPEDARQKLEEHAKALGCAPAELAAFLFSRREARRNAVLTSAG